MSDDDLEDDEIERDDDNDADEKDDGDDLPVADHDDGDDDGSDAPVVKSRKKPAAQSEAVEGLSLEAKEREREMLARQMEEFMARGGKIQEVGANVVADPPKKPEGKYGSRPI